MRASSLVRRGTGRPAIAALLIATCLSCSGSGYQFVKDSSSTAFFKIPDSWTLFNEDEILNSGGIVASPQSKDAFAQASWMVEFDASRDPSIGDVLSVDARDPTGFAQVRPLGLEERDSFSISSLRNALFSVDGTDPSAPPAELLSSEDVLLPGGYHGVRIEYNVKSGDEYITVSQVGVVDPSTSTLYLFAIGCEAHCYMANQSTINQITDSWTVKESST